MYVFLLFAAIIIMQLLFSIIWLLIVYNCNTICSYVCFCIVCRYYYRAIIVLYYLGF